MQTFCCLKFLKSWLVSENICTQKIQIQNISTLKFPNLWYDHLDYHVHELLTFRPINGMTILIILHELLTFQPIKGLLHDPEEGL